VFPGFRMDHRLTGRLLFLTDELPTKNNCRSFVVRRGGLLWMTSVIVSTG
jgi:hypothetical protein